MDPLGREALERRRPEQAGAALLGTVRAVLGRGEGGGERCAPLLADLVLVQREALDGTPGGRGADICYGRPQASKQLKSRGLSDGAPVLRDGGRELERALDADAVVLEAEGAEASLLEHLG